MNPLITIDHGNTKTKCFLHRENQGSIEVSQNDIKILIQNNTCPQIIQSTVLTPEKTEQRVHQFFPAVLKLKQISWTHFFKNNLFLDMPTDYAQSIGQDRLCQIYYLFRKLSDFPCLFIDAGTFLTIDLIQKQKHVGGYILPGTEKMISLYGEGSLLKTFLPKDLFQSEHTNSWPVDSNQAISFGIEKIYLETIKSLIQSSNVKCLYFTGGWGENLSRKFLEMNSTQNLQIKFQNDLIHHSLSYIAHSSFIKNQ